MDREYAADRSGIAMDGFRAVADQQAMMKNAVMTGGIASAQMAEQPKLRERLYEIEKLLSDSNNAIREGADRLFGVSPASMVGVLNQKSFAEDAKEPPLAQIIDRILNLTRSNREEAMRFNRIG